MKRIFYTSLFYLILGLGFGVFYREYTKMKGFEGQTALSVVHPHILSLGFIFFIIVIILYRTVNLGGARYINVFYYLYNIGLLISIFSLAFRGIIDVAGRDSKIISYVAGTGHLVLAVGLAFFMRSLFLAIKDKNQ